MAISQNVRFSGQASADPEFDDPPGASLARLLKEALARRGWKVSEIDIWRDGGWSVTCCRLPSRLDVVILKLTTGSEWILQIAPSYVPRLVGWVLRKPSSAQPEDVHALAQDAFLILSEAGFQEFLWCWDGYPEAGIATAAPAPAQYRA